MIKTSIATVSISGDFREKLSAIAAAGFDGIEIFEQDFLSSDLSPAEVGKMVRDQGLEITLFQPFRDFEGLPEPYRAQAFARAVCKFDVMQQLGTDLMLICSSVHPKSLGGIERCADDLRELGDMAKARGLRVGYEALAWGRHVNDHRDAWEIVRRADHSAVGIILDSFHTLARKTDPDTIRRIPGDRIFFVQLADAPKIDMDPLYWSRHFRNMPGEGDLDVQGFLRAVFAAGYKGPLSLEIFNDEFRSGNAKIVAAAGHRSLVYAVDRLQRENIGLDLGTTPLPDRAAVSAIPFLEFATSNKEAASIESSLSQLGFSCNAKHVSKKVSRWQQNEINILINTEPSGYAASAFTMHGTTVSDICLKVPDARAAKKRALALGATSFDQDVDAGQIDFPSIRGVGGGVIRLFDDGPTTPDLWDTDFKKLGAELPTSDAGLLRVDHLAQTMAYDEMLSWTSFYTSIFEATRAPMVEVIDPGGLVRSQAIEGADKNLRVTLNGAESHRTLAGRFIADSFGGAVQHIALATDDIFATAAKLAQNGFPVLNLSGNYYDDVAARFGLRAEFTDQLHANNIMYDRDDNGEFFQLYGKSFAGGIFFEIVQRKGAYAGYGAANAPFRIAAQRREGKSPSMPRN